MADYVGRIQGDYGVDSDGAATYSVPIEVPPGTAGMMPKLSVVYNSGGGDDLLGMGWSVRGLSSIGRSRRTVAQDGQFGPVSYDIHDRFSLDGQRLVPVSGSYGAPDAVYRTEIESWTKVVPVYYGQGGNTMQPVAGRSGPDAFIVYSKDGKLHEYGTSPDAQIVASPDNPSIRVWALNKITDLFGNYLTITYDLDPANNTFYPLRVQYTGNDNTGLTPQRTVVFSYEARPSGADAVPHFRGGHPFTTTRRLSGIETVLDGDSVLTYRLNYRAGQATGRSQLVSITQADTTGAALPATMFGWPDDPEGLFAPDQPVTLPPNTVAWQGTLLPMDINGDGRVDLVNAYSCGDNLGLTILLSDGKSFTPIALPVTEIPFGTDNQLLAIDVNGDGCIDLVCAGSTDGCLGLTVLTSEADGNGRWTLVPGELNGAGPTGLPSGGRLTALDVDGDGLVDLVYAYREGNALKLAVLFSNGSTFAPSRTDQTSISVEYHPHAQYLALDFNGDGMTDLLYAYQTGDELTFALFLSKGRQGFQQTTLETPSGIPTGGALFALDANGDGIGDVVHSYVDENGDLAVQTILSNGVSFQPLVQQQFSLPASQSPPMVLPMEVNGDGLPDLIVATSDGSAVELTALLATGSGYTRADITQPSEAVPGRSHLLPVDYNGDGRTDLVYAFPSSGIEQELVLRTMPVVGPFPDLITSITDGLGGQISIDYGPLTDPDIYHASAGATLDPRTLLNNSVSGSTFQLSAAGGIATGTPGVVPATRLVLFPKYVVSSYTKSDGRGNSYGYQHSYGGARIDLTGRGWLGFAVGTAVDHSQGTTTQTDYQQLFPHTHTPASATVSRTSDAALMQQMKLAYTEPTTAPYLVVPRQQETTFFTLGCPDFTQTTSFTYDTYGNVTFKAEKCDCAASLPHYTTETYQNDHGRWRLGYKLESKVTADEAGTQILNWRKMTYSPDTNALHTASDWDDHNQVWQTTSFAYDAYGNRTTVTDASHASTTTTYDPTYHSFPATRTTPPTANAAHGLTSTFDYYPAFGVRAKATDPNGTVTTQQIDGLGRVTASLGPDPSGAQVVLNSHVWGNNGGDNYREVRSRIDWAGTAWRWSRHYLDGLGRTYRTATLGPDGATTVYVDYTLNSKGQPVSESLPYYEGQAAGATTYVYDVYARPLSATQPRPDADSAPIVTTFTYPSVLTKIQTDGYGTSQTRTQTAHFGHYGGKKVLVRSVEEVTGAISFTYDVLGRITSATDAKTTSTVGYDTLGRRLNAKVVSIDHGTTLFAESVHYDDVNRAVTQHDAAGNSIVRTYDALHRLSKKQVGSDPPTTITYDLPEHSNALGRASSVTLPDGSSYGYAYDPYGNQTSITLALEGGQYHIQKSYTPTGKLQQLTYPAASRLAIANSYNAAGCLTAVTPDKGAPSSYVTYTGYTAFGVPATVTYGNGATETAAFDGLERLLSRELAGSDGNTIINTSWQWDPLNQLTTIKDGINPTQSQTFGFDGTGRLTGADGGYPSQEYAYDAAGNLTLKDGITYSYDGCMVTQGTLDGKVVLTAEHDAVGSRTSLTRDGDTTTYAYDGERRLIHCGGTTFSYDHTGRRLKKQTTAGTTTYYVSPYYEVTAFADGSTQHTAYIFGINGPLASITTVESGSGNSTGTAKGIPMPGTFYFHKDQIGSTIALTDAQGAVTSRVTYLPYGEIASLTGPDCFRQKFTGKELDEETGLYYFNARYYDPIFGRFLTLDDRIGGQGSNHTGLNLYAYALNDPTSNVDPSGHSVFSDIAGVVDATMDAIKSAGSDLTKAVKNVFSNDVPSFFQHYWQQVICFSVDAGLIIVGGSLLALTPFTGSPQLGSMLLGAGVAGLTYNITQLATHQKFSWKNWGVQVGLGAATGLAGGILGGAASLLASSDLVTTMAARLGLAEELTPLLLKAAIQIPGAAALGAAKQLATAEVYHQHISWSQVGIGAAIGAGTAYFTLTTATLVKAISQSAEDAEAVSTEATDDPSSDADAMIHVKPSTTLLSTLKQTLPRLFLGPQANTDTYSWEDEQIRSVFS